MTPVTMMALDKFVLWVNAEAPYKTAKEYFDAVKAAGPSKMKMGGTGSKQEDQILTVGVEKATGTKFIYIPFKGGGEVAVQLVGKHVDSSVNNPIEAVAQWRAGKLRALCVFDDKRMPYKARSPTPVLGDVSRPARKRACRPSTLMLRGIFMPPGVTPSRPTLRRPPEEGARNAGVEGVHGEGRVQPDLHGRQGIRRLDRRYREEAQGPDAGSRLHRRELMRA
jgi:putative tricarboxylic transport membrane protein